MYKFKPKPYNAQEEVFLPPLFDRLSLRGTQFLDEEGVKQSVQEELSRLLNTRLGHGRVQVDDAFKREEEEGVTSYVLPDLFGVEDFSAVSMEDSSSWKALERQIERACAAYDPRLQNPKVTLLRDSLDTQKLVLSLSGDILLGERTIHISFPLVLEGIKISEGDKKNKGEI